MFGGINFENVWLSIVEFWSPVIGIGIFIIAVLLFTKFAKDKKNNRKF